MPSRRVRLRKEFKKRLDDIRECPLCGAYGKSLAFEEAQPFSLLWCGECGLGLRSRDGMDELISRWNKREARGGVYQRKALEQAYGAKAS